jgi:uncharacterized membrane protein (DUF441 family)
MWKSIKPILGEILSSKKALALIAGAIVWALAQAGVGASEAQVLPLLGFIATYILGQGIADKGKEEAKIIAKSLGKSPAPVLEISQK